jgi:hypothetical protein
MSFIVEQAGGKGSDGHQRILDITPTEVCVCACAEECICGPSIWFKIKMDLPELDVKRSTFVLALCRSTRVPLFIGNVEEVEKAEKFLA